MTSVSFPIYEGDAILSAHFCHRWSTDGASGEVVGFIPNVSVVENAGVMVVVDRDFFQQDYGD